MAEPGRKPATYWKIALGIFLLLVAAVNSTRPTTGGTAGAVGGLIGLLLLVLVGGGLIASGLPKTLGNEAFRKARRRLWYLLMGAGLVVMLVLGFGLMIANQPLAGVFVSWVYWFIWSWVSWRIADKRVRQRPPFAA